MISSAETDKIVPALVAALSTMEDITKNRKAEIPTKTGGKFSYTFADLSDVLGYLRPKLAEQGLAVMQEPFTDEKGTAIATTIMHSSGQWIESRPLRLPTGADAQSHGSSITFARRYQILAQLGLATEDDDGATARPAPPQRQQAQKPATASTSPSEAVTKRAMAMFKEAGIEAREDRLQFTSYVAKRAVQSWNDVSPNEASDVIETLDKVIAGKVTMGFEADGTLALSGAT